MTFLAGRRRPSCSKGHNCQPVSGAVYQQTKLLGYLLPTLFCFANDAAMYNITWLQLKSHDCYMSHQSLSIQPLQHFQLMTTLIDSVHQLINECIAFCLYAPTEQGSCLLAPGETQNRKCVSIVTLCSIYYPCLGPTW